MEENTEKVAENIETTTSTSDHPSISYICDERDAEKYSKITDDYVRTIEYRGFKIPIYRDDDGQQFYAAFPSEKYKGTWDILGFGAFNMNYEDDVRYLIDQRLDVIYTFSYPYFGAVLEYFDNVGYRDIRLKYRRRTLKVYAVLSDEAKLSDATLEMIKKDSKELLDKIIDREKA